MPVVIPTNAAAFKMWADRECGAWPWALQTLGWRAWRELVGNGDAQAGSFDKFKQEFEQWERETN